MATPRSIAGFEKAIADVNEKIEKINADLVDAAPEDEDALYADKADLEVEVAIITQKFEEFKAKQNEAAEVEPEVAPEPEPETKPEPKAKAKAPETKPAEKVWPEVGIVTVVRGGYMVNPHNHTRHDQGALKEVILDSWTISQIKAGIMALK